MADTTPGYADYLQRVFALGPPSRYERGRPVASSDFGPPDQGDSFGSRVGGPGYTAGYLNQEDAEHNRAYAAKKVLGALLGGGSGMLAAGPLGAAAGAGLGQWYATRNDPEGFRIPQGADSSQQPRDAASAEYNRKLVGDLADRNMTQNVVLGSAIPYLMGATFPTFLGTIGAGTAAGMAREYGNRTGRGEPGIAWQPWTSGDWQP